MICFKQCMRFSESLQILGHQLIANCFSSGGSMPLETPHLLSEYRIKGGIWFTLRLFLDCSNTVFSLFLLHINRNQLSVNRRLTNFEFGRCQGGFWEVWGKACQEEKQNIFLVVLWMSREEEPHNIDPCYERLLCRMANCAEHCALQAPELPYMYCFLIAIVLCHDIQDPETHFLKKY